jgi:thioredoxin:protein disulfide reductase
MFDVFTLQMPAGFQEKLGSASSKVPGGKFAGVFAMGGLSALIVGPCVAGPLAGALIYISKTGNVLTGGVALFFLSLGMSQLLLLTGLSGKLLLKAGAWMEGVKRFFGLLLFATALWLANSILHPAVFMISVAMLLLMAALWLSAFTPLPVASGLVKTAGKSAGLLMVGIAAMQIVGVASGGREVLQPLKQLASARTAAPLVAGASTANASTLQFTTIKNDAELANFIKTSDKPVVLDFYADWCTSCKEMEHGTFTDPRVVDLMSKAKFVRADVTKNSPEDRALMKRYELFGPPALLVLKTDGQEVKSGRVIGYKSADPFLAQMQTALAQK